MASTGLDNIDVLILCGGKGERLSGVLKGRPKPLAKIGAKVFLDILIDRIQGFGFKRILLSVGYHKEQIVKHYSNPEHYALEFCEEDTVLGTGGAVKNARSSIESDPFLVMNGDSICDVDLLKFYRFHLFG